MKALEEFAEESNLDQDLHMQIKNFLANNHLELFAKVDEESLINELPPTIKEELFFHMYGSLLESLEFFQQLDNDCTWAIIKCLKKVKYDKGDKIYHDKDLSDNMYLIHKGTVKLYAENDYPFAQYKNGAHFGEADMFCGTTRNGTAQTSEDSQLYKISKSNMDEVLTDFPSIRRKLV